MSRNSGCGWACSQASQRSCSRPQTAKRFAQGHAARPRFSFRVPELPSHCRDAVLRGVREPASGALEQKRERCRRAAPASASAHKRWRHRVQLAPVCRSPVGPIHSRFLSLSASTAARDRTGHRGRRRDAVAPSHGGSSAPAGLPVPPDRSARLQPRRRDCLSAYSNANLIAPSAALPPEHAPAIHLERTRFWRRIELLLLVVNTTPPEEHQSAGADQPFESATSRRASTRSSSPQSAWWR